MLEDDNFSTPRSIPDEKTFIVDNDEVACTDLALIVREPESSQNISRSRQSTPSRNTPSRNTSSRNTSNHNTSNHNTSSRNTSSHNTPCNKSTCKKNIEYEKFIKLNNQMENDYDKMINKIKLFDNDSFQKITFNFKKDKFDKDICDKLTKLNQKIRIMDKKNSSYKNCFDCVNISIILLSSILTLVESFKSEFEDDFSEQLKKYLKLSPIILSSIITCAASILKFKKFQEKIESLTKIKEKAIVMNTRFKKLKENISYVENLDNLNDLIQHYNKEIYEQYAGVQQEVSQCISNKDYKYLFPIFEIDSKIHILNNKRSFFFQNYNYPKNPIEPQFIEKKCIKCDKKICCCF